MTRPQPILAHFPPAPPLATFHLLQPLLPTHLGSAGEQLADALEDGIGQGPGGEGDDEAVVRQGGQVGDHGISLVLGVVDHHIQAGHGVVLALHGPAGAHSSAQHAVQTVHNADSAIPWRQLEEQMMGWCDATLPLP